MIRSIAACGLLTIPVVLTRALFLGPLIFVADHQAVETAAKKIAYKGFGGRPLLSSISGTQRTAMPPGGPGAGLNSLAFPFSPRSRHFPANLAIYTS
jgi:hypothetical protein